MRTRRHLNPADRTNGALAVIRIAVEGAAHHLGDVNDDLALGLTLALDALEDAIYDEREDVRLPGMAPPREGLHACA